MARGLRVDDVERINHWATDALEPDLTIMLDLPIGTSSQRDGEVDRMENEGELFQARSGVACSTWPDARPTVMP